MNIVLIGYRCSGKSTVGSLLAERLERPFVDTDRVIENRIGRSIQDFIAQAGWPSFRRIERQTVRDLAVMHDLVIATGGGVVLDPENIADLKTNGWVIWLKADATAIRSRMQQDPDSALTRPSLTGDDPRSEIEQVLETRGMFYESAGDCILDTACKTPQVVTEEILALLSWSGGAGRDLSGRSDLLKPLETEGRHAR